MTIQISEKSNIRALRSGVSSLTAHPIYPDWEPASLLSYAIQAAYSDDDNEDDDDDDEWDDDDWDEDDDEDDEDDWEDDDEDE